MNRIRMGASALALLAVTLVAETSAIAAPPTATAMTATPAPQAPPDTRQTAHASLRLDIRRTKAWVGQAIPVTLQAYFRGAEGVTLEGAPQLTSAGIFTSDLSREPRQSTEMIGGEPVLVATWTGTVTPSSAGPLVLAAELPVQIRYRDAAARMPQPADPFGDDPFGALGANPFDMSAINRFMQQAMQQSLASLGSVRQEGVSLRSTARPIDVQDPPAANQPASFTGAVGRFKLKASVTPSHGRVSEPVTLRMVVDGDGDLDRVDLAGVASSGTWKAYPPKATLEAASRGKPARKVFEQVLVPLRGGDLSIPPVSLTSFDPDSGRYVTRETPAIPVSVDGTAVVAEVTPPPAPPGQPIASPPLDGATPDVPHVVSPARVALWLTPLALVLAIAAFVARARRRRTERALRRTMRKAASHGDPIPFYRAAHALIETILSGRWGVRPEDVTPFFIRERLGPLGGPLADALAADETLRFGRGRLERADLVPLCSSIERTLGGAS